ncbi:unnamed protein product, partial [Amoebophrya sp. A25]
MSRNSSGEESEQMQEMATPSSSTGVALPSTTGAGVAEVVTSVSSSSGRNQERT